MLVGARINWTDHAFAHRSLRRRSFIFHRPYVPMAVINPDISGLWNPERLLEVVHRAWGSSKGFGPPRDKQRHRAHNSTLVYPSAGLKSHSGQNVVHCIAPKHCTSDFLYVPSYCMWFQKSGNLLQPVQGNAPPTPKKASTQNEL